MAIKPPNWCSNAIPGLNGWTDAKTGEVYASARFTQDQINAFYSKTVVANIPTAPVEVAIEVDAVAIHNDDLDLKTRSELEEIAIVRGIDTEGRKSKKALIEIIRENLS
jgi:hypothetical protein